MKFLRKVLDKVKRKEIVLDVSITEEKENVIILDTSALETKETMKILEEASKVILLTGTIREMDKYKDAGGNLGDNIRIISRKSREDKESKKYICVAGYEKNHYQDDNIIEYCKINKNTVILTRDNNLCNMAKAYGIPYIFPEDEEVKKINKSGMQNIEEVTVKNGYLYLSKEKSENITFIVRKKEVIQQSLDCDTKIQLGDLIYKVKHKCDSIIISSYEIRNMEHSQYAKYTFSLKINYYELEKINDSALPENVRRQILYLLEEKQEIKKEQDEPEIKDEGKKETKLQEKQGICQDVYFYHNSIRANAQKNHVKYVKVERDRKLIQIKDYQEGDVLYILDYNDKSKIVKVNVYNIEKAEGVYTAKKESENIIWYINEIFRSKFSEEMKDVIWKFYVKYSGY